MLSNTELFTRLLLAAAFGSVIGFERERLLWAAGLRTHMLVCVGSSLIMIVSAFGFSDIVNDSHVVLDPSRIAAQVVSGIGFLGAGTILLRGEVVKGLTTAASLWSVAAIGLAVGGGLYVAALSTTIIILLILAGVKPLEERFRSQMAVRTIRLRADHDILTLDIVHEMAGLRASRVKQFVLRQHPEDGTDEILVSFIRLSHQSVEDIAGKLRDVAGVKAVEVID
jgi:putative Mg2+ transporter-C (MgtC) family protein